jgi:hypothetical protein
MFMAQFSLTLQERGLRDICVFVVRVYMKACFTAPLTASAINNDLHLLHLLVQYRNESPSMSKLTNKKFSGHLWYLSEEMVGLSFSDSTISIQSKRAMVRALSESEGLDEAAKRIQLDLMKCVNMNIEDFVTKNTELFFHRMEIQTGFLETDPELWLLDGEYLKGQATVHHLQVVNDNAERGCRLLKNIMQFSLQRSNRTQYLLQVVEDQRRRFPDCAKATLISD